MRILHRRRCFSRNVRRSAPVGACARGTVLLFFLALVALPRFAWADNWALLIGIDQYDDTNHIASLGGASADAKAIRQTLIATGYPEDQIKTLTSDGEVKPTRTEILKSLAWLSNNARPGDTVFVLYSGHGIDVKGTPYLLPYDTSALNDDTITDTALETSKFRSRLGQLKARALILAFDMCRSDPFEKGKGLAGADNLLSRSVARGLNFSQTAKDGGASPQSSAASPIAVTLYSCAEGERSYEWQDKGRGYFSYYLEKGLRGAAADATGHVTVGSLTAYVEKNVKAAVAREEHREQTPYPSLDGPGASDYVIVMKPSTAAEIASAMNGGGQPAHDSRPPAVKPPKAAPPRKKPEVAVVAKPNRPAAPVVPAAGHANYTAYTDSLRPAIPANTGRALSVAFSPDGKYVAGSLMGNSGLVTVWGAQSGEPMRSLEGQYTFDAIAFSPDGRRLLTAGSGGVQIWDVTSSTRPLETQHRLGKILGSINGVAFSPDGKHVAAASLEGGRVWIWNSANGSLEHIFENVGQDGVFTVEYSPDSRAIVTSSADGTAKIIDAETGAVRHSLGDNSGFVNTAAFSHDGRFVVTGGEGKAALLWDAASGKPIDSFPCQSTLHSVGFSPDDQYILASGENGIVHVITRATRADSSFATTGGGVTFAAFSPSNRYIVVGQSDGEIKIIDTKLN